MTKPFKEVPQEMTVMDAYDQEIERLDKEILIETKKGQLANLKRMNSVDTTLIPSMTKKGE